VIAALIVGAVLLVALLVIAAMARRRLAARVVVVAEGLSRRIAYYKCVALVEGTNIVRRELGLPEARVRTADPRLYFAGG
jgi:hypothetical protein